MQFTCRDIARQMVAQMGLEGGPELAAQWVGQRYAELTARARFRHLRQYGQLYIPAPITAGSCTITLDSPLVLFDSTAQAAFQNNAFFQWPQGFADLWFRPQIGTSWYRIVEAGTDGSILLETPYAEDNGYLLTGGTTVQSGVTFYILPRYIALDPSARQLGVFACDFLFRPMHLVSEDDINRMYSNRFLISSYPQYVAELNNNADMTGFPKMVEIYPWPAQSVTMHYTYWQTPQILSWDQYLPPTIDPDTLRTGASIDAAASQLGKAIRMGNFDAAKFWSGEKNNYLGLWESKIGRAIRNDRGAEDRKFVSRSIFRLRPNDWDAVSDAYENFLARGY